MRPGRLWRTLRNLESEQISNRLRRALARPRSMPGHPAPVRPRPCRWAPRIHSQAEPEQPAGHYRFWGTERRLDLGRAWLAADLGDSWNYPVHYFDAAPALAQAARDANDVAGARAVIEWMERWIDSHPPGARVAWDPYPTALRIVNWLEVVRILSDGAPTRFDRVLRSLHLQASALLPRLERHLLGTHLLKDLKALAFAGHAFLGADAARWRAVGEEGIRRELARQVHPDGGHLEPSVHYHALALEDVLDLVNLGVASRDLADLLRQTAVRMLAFLARVVAPGDAFPLLGDAERHGWPRAAALFDYAHRLGFDRPSPPAGLDWLQDSGLAVCRDPRTFWIADVGSIGPPHLSGHGHCDSLAFEWFLDGLAYVVDAGTRSYEVGPDRAASRGTRAHNTIEIDGREQHEIWEAFRVGARSEVHTRVDHGVVVSELTPWFDTRMRIERRFVPRAAGLRIEDAVHGPGRHRLASRIHLHPECAAQVDGTTVRMARGTSRARLVLQPGTRFELRGPERSGSACCERAGQPRPNACLEIFHEGELPWRSVFEISGE